jgi:hypothetical protein
MKTSAPGLDPQLAWALWYELAKLSFFLWDCYREDFLKLAEEERVCRGTDSEEDLEIQIPF